MAIGPRLALEAERVAEVESDDGGARELQQEVAQRPDGDGMRNVSAFGFGGLGVPRVHFPPRCRLQFIEQIVRLHSLSLAPAHLHVRLAHLFFRELVSHLRGATRRKRHHVIRKMDRTRGLFLKTQRAQPGHNDVLQIRLPRIDHVIHDVGMPELRRARFALIGRAGPQRVAVWIPVESQVSEIAAQQSEFPKLIGDVFAHIGDRAVGAHDHFGRVVGLGRIAFRAAAFGAVLYGVFFALEVHHPASGIFPRSRQMNGAAHFQLLKGGLPELQVQDFALARQQVILHAEPLHGAQMAAHDRHGNDLRQFGRRTMPFFDGRERLAAQGQAALILLEKLRDPRIEVPAEVIEARSRGQRANLFGRFFLQMSERDHHIRDLHAGVVDVVLHFHSPACAPQQPHERIAQGGVAQMPDVRGFIGIDVGVLDHVLGLAGLLAGCAGFRTASDSGVRRFGESRLKKCRAIEEEIDVPRAGQFHARHSGNRRKFGGNLLRDLARCAAEALGQSRRQSEWPLRPGPHSAAAA